MAGGERHPSPHTTYHLAATNFLGKNEMLKALFSTLPDPEIAQDNTLGGGVVGQFDFIAASLARQMAA
jgi:hypothetical protein